MSDNVLALVVSFASLGIALTALGLTIYRDWRSLHPCVDVEVRIVRDGQQRVAVLRIVNLGPGPVSIRKIMLLRHGSRSPFPRHWTWEPVDDPVEVRLRDAEDRPAFLRIAESVFPFTLENTQERSFTFQVEAMGIADDDVRTIAVLDHLGRRHIVRERDFVAAMAEWYGCRDS